MPTSTRSFAKINIGLCIGARRADGFHDLRTVYQTIALHDRVRVSLSPGDGIEVHCSVPGVPLDSSNTCSRMAELAMRAMGGRGRVAIEIEKNLPIQGGLGAGSSNAVSTLLALERELGKQLTWKVKRELAAEVGSDLPLFLVGGTVLGVGRGEEVHAVPELPPTACVVATPAVAVSTPQAFADWDAHTAKLTPSGTSDRINLFSSEVFLWLNGFLSGKEDPRRPSSGVPAEAGGGRAETLLLDLVRTGIANDFETVVFSQHPELGRVKRILQDEGAHYASLSGSGSSLYALFLTAAAAEKAAGKVVAAGVPAVVTRTLTRQEYWQQVLDTELSGPGSE